MVDLAGMHDGLRSGSSAVIALELYDRIADLERLRSRVDERLMAHKATLDSLGDAGADSAVVGRSVGRRSERQAKKDMVTARGLAEMPALAESLAEGRLNVEHAAIVADAAEHVTPEVAEALVKTAEAMPADLFARKALEFVGKHTSAAEAEERHAKQRARRAGWHKTHGDGSVEIHARFDKATGEQIVARGDDAPTACGTTTAATTASRRRTHTCPTPGRCLGRVDLRRAADGPVRPRHQVHIVWNLDEPSATWLDGTPSPTPSSCNSDPQPTSSDTSSTAPDTPSGKDVGSGSPPKPSGVP